MGKGKKKRNDDDWENDLDEIAKEAGIDLSNQSEEVPDIPQPSKKEKKKKKGKVEEKNEELEEDKEENEVTGAPSKKANKSKPSFSSLMLEDDEDDNDEPSDQESPEEIVTQTQSKSKKKKDKKKKNKNDENDDIADILNDLELTDKKEDKSSKKSKKKKKKDQDLEDVHNIEDNENQEQETNKTEPEQTEKAEDVENENKDNANENKDNDNKEDTEDGSGMKTAAQKRAEKKEREKKKKQEDKKKAKKKKKEAAAGAAGAAAEEGNEESAKVEDKPEDTAQEDQPKVEDNEGTVKAEGGEEVEKEGESGDEGEGKDKKKKKKKKKKGGEEEKEDKKKTKKPNKAAIARMQEALEEVKREEERLRLEAEAKAKAEEEAEEARLEKLRLEKEKKEKKKQKEKERIARLKKEGKFLTPAQKEQKRKAEAMLAAMREQGIHVPSKDDTTAAEKPKRPQYGRKKKPGKNNQQQKQKEEVTEETKTEEPPKSPEPTKEEPQEKKKEEEKKEDVTDSWDANDADDGIADSWDAEEDKEDKEKEKAQAETKEKGKKLETQVSTKSKEEAEGESSSEEEDESDEEESSDEESDSEDESESESESESEEEDTRLTPERIKERARDRIERRKLANENNRTTDVLRAPVVCVLGHVDTGKTKILDKIRRTNVQDGEAGGITQQIGATNIPVEKIKEQTKMVKEFQKFDLKLPGLLIIDTPGHESFSNLRSRGSNLCDMAILVVDIMHGLEPQTIESINLLKKKQTPFVVALNKIDRLYEWKKAPNMQVEDTVKNLKKIAKQEFEERTNLVINQFAEQGLNAALHFKNIDEKSYISLVPTSAHSGDGMGDLMAIICRLTQTRLAKKLAFSEELESTVMEVKAIPGLGMTIDVILVNGQLKEGDTIVTGGIDGAIITQIRSVLTPQPMRELRVKAQYIHHKCLRAAQGVKLIGKDLDKVLAGSPVFVAQNPDEVEVLREEVEEFVSSSLKAIKVAERGVYVQASTLGSLEALLEFLKTSKIPYCGVNIGPVHKRDIMKCSVMLEHEPMYAVVLAFDVKVERDAQEYADKEGIKIFTAEIIYHLFDKFTAYCEEYKDKQREKHKHLAVYPCKLKIMPEHIFNTRDPIVLGVNVEAGTLRIGTPIIVPAKGNVFIGFVTGIEANHKQLEKAQTGQEVCVKIDAVPGEAPKLFGRHFTDEDIMCSRINRESIDIMKQYFRDDMVKSDWQLIIELKKLLSIM
eukprot:TCONS_00013108-protein